MKRRQAIRQVQRLSARLDEENSELAISLKRLSASLGQKSPVLVVGGGLLAGFFTGRVFRAVRSGPLRRVYRLLLLARGWAGRLSFTRTESGVAAGVGNPAGIDS